MLTLDEYRANPCRSASLPWWKIPLYPDTPESFGIHEDDVDPYDPRPHERYFRLFHALDVIPEAPMPDGFSLSTLDPVADTAAIVDLINASYPLIRVNADSVARWRSYPAFDATLWRGIWVEGQLVGSVIADLDPTVPEASIDWVQLLPAYRGRGLALALLVDVLQRCVGRADFATVSGDCDNETDPEALYRRAGFTGQDVWCIYQG